jgi:hypothetical protein
MALQLDKDLLNGFYGQYWKISSVIIDSDMKTVNINVSLYKDLASRQANYQAVSGTSFRLLFDNYDNIMSSTNFLAGCYDYVKAQPEFAGCIDV